MSDIVGFPDLDRLGPEYDPELLERRGPQNITFGLRLSKQCDHCQTYNPIAGITPRFICYKCTKPNDFGDERWAEMIDDDIFRFALYGAYGRGTDISRYGLTTKLRYRRVKPHCQKCAAELPLSAIKGAVESGACTCPDCAASISFRRAPIITERICPGARFILGEGAIAEEGASEARAHPPTKAVAIACLQCGAGLRVDGSSRMVTCEHCDTSNYLPDGLWLQLHPIPEVREFYLLATYTEEQYWAHLTGSRRMMALAVEREIELPEVALQQLATSENPDVQRAMVGLRGMIDEQQLRLAREGDDDTKASLANDPNTPKETLMLLAEESDPRVREALARNPALDGEVLEAFARTFSPFGLEELAARGDLHKLTPAACGSLLERAGSHARDLLSNPSFPLATVPGGALMRMDPAAATLLAQRCSELTAKQITELFADSAAWMWLETDSFMDLFVALAKAPASPEGVLHQLAERGSLEIKRAVATNPSTSLATLKALAQRKHPELQAAIKQHPRWASRSWIARLLG